MSEQHKRVLLPLDHNIDVPIICVLRVGCHCVHDSLILHLMHGETRMLSEISRRGIGRLVEDLSVSDLYRPYIIRRRAEDGLCGGLSALFILFRKIFTNRVPCLSICRFRIRVAKIRNLPGWVGAPVLLLGIYGLPYPPGSICGTASGQACPLAGPLAQAH